MLPWWLRMQLFSGHSYRERWCAVSLVIERMEAVLRIWWNEDQAGDGNEIITCIRHSTRKSVGPWRGTGQGVMCRVSEIWLHSAYDPDSSQ